MTRNGAVFAVCLLLAILLLLLNKLSRNYIGDVKARIHYTQLPAGKVPTAPLPDALKLYIEASGFKLLWTRMRKPSEVQINLSALKTDYLVTLELRSVIASQLSSDYKLIEIIPDSLHFKFDNGITKKVRVVPDILISFKKQYDFLEPLVVSPDSVLVSGPQNILDTIKSWKTERVLLENLEKSVQAEVALSKPSFSNIILQPKKIRYVLGVEEYTEKTLEVTIEKINFPEKRELSIFPAKANVIFRVGLSNYEHVNEETFKVVADFAGIDMNRSKYVPVKVEFSPSYIKNLDYSPKSVEYIIYR